MLVCACVCAHSQPKNSGSRVTQLKIADASMPHQKLVPVCIRGVPICECAGIQKNSHMGSPRTHNEIVRIWGLTCLLPVFLLRFLVLSRNSPRELKDSCLEQARRLVHVVQASSSKCLFQNAWHGQAFWPWSKKAKMLHLLLSVVKQVQHCSPYLSG